MEKTLENRKKDEQRTHGKRWVNEHTTFEKRTCSSGVVFRGKYVKK